MKLVLLGTGAAESYPGLWCNCRHCAQARKNKGKDIRSTSSAVIDEDLLLDLGPQCFDRAVQSGINLSRIHGLLITHPHEDHFYPKHLLWRQTNEENVTLEYDEQKHKGGPRFTTLPILEMFGAASTKKALLDYIEQPIKEGQGGETASLESLKIDFHEYVSGEVFWVANKYRVRAIQGNHGPYPGYSHSYIIQKDGKTILYALDSGIYPKESLDMILSYKYDCIVVEGTTGLNTSTSGHLCMEENIRLKKLLEKNECISQETPFVLTHLSPHWCPPHEEYQEMLSKYEITVGYDGMAISI